MAGILDRLVYEVGYEVDKSSFDNVKKGVGEITSVLKTMTKVAFGAGTAILGFTAITTAQIAETERLAKSVGTTTDLTEAFGAEFERIGGTQENFIDLMEEMNNKIGEMKGLGELGTLEESLEILNIKFEDLQKLAPEEQFRKITESALALEDSQKAVTAVDMLMGGEANKLIGSLRAQGLTYDDVVRKQQLYNFQTEESRKGALRFDNSMKDFRKVLGSLSNFIAGALGENISNLINQFTEWATANKEVIASGIKDFVKTLSLIFSTLWTVLRAVTNIITGVTDAFGGMGAVIRLLIATGVVLGILRIAKGFAIIGIAVKRATFNMALMSKVMTKLKNLLLIGAIVVIFEDLYNWINGNNSVMGLLVGNFEDWWASMKIGLDILADFGKSILEFILVPFNLVIDQINNIMRLINSLSATTIGEKLGIGKLELISKITPESLGGTIGNLASSAVNNIGGAISNTATNTANIIVNATGDPQAIAIAVQSQLDKTFNSANKALQPTQK